MPGTCPTYRVVSGIDTVGGLRMAGAMHLRLGGFCMVGALHLPHLAALNRRDLGFALRRLALPTPPAARVRLRADGGHQKKTHSLTELDLVCPFLSLSRICDRRL